LPLPCDERRSDGEQYRSGDLAAAMHMRSISLCPEN
jgi:hypothetical protein